MAKKMFVRAKTTTGNRWRIDFTTNFDGNEVRHRREFNLNEIEDTTVRQHVATAICEFLEGFDFLKLLPVAPDQPEVVATLREKIENIRVSKNGYDRKNTRKTYNSGINSFLKWAEKNGYDLLPYTQFTYVHANEYILSVKNGKHKRSTGPGKPYAPRTINNRLTQIRTVFKEMLKREKIENPFTEEKKVRVTEKHIRIFEDNERAKAAKWIEENDYWLFRGLLLQYYCYIRPREISALKFRDFDLANGLVKVSMIEGKNWKDRYATIPQSVMHYFRDGIFDRQPGNYFLFGRVGDGSKRTEHKMGPAKVQAREDRPYKKHVAYLRKMKQLGILNDIEGLTWYSWKHTGISRHVPITTPVSTKDQAGHSKFDTTLIYYQVPKINPEYQNLPADLF